METSTRAITITMLTALLLTSGTTATSGCAHYQMGDPSRADGPADVGVETVAVPASWGIETDQLTRRFVDDLDARLDVRVRWEDDAPVVLSCTLDDLRQQGYADRHAADVVARCRRSVDDQTRQLRATGSAMSSSPDRRSDGAAALAAGSTTVRRAASRRALEGIADQFADRFEEQRWENDSTAHGTSSVR